MTLYPMEKIVDTDAAGNMQVVAGHSTLRLFKDGTFLSLLDSYQEQPPQPPDVEFRAAVTFSPDGQQIAFLSAGALAEDGTAPLNATLKLWNNSSLVKTIVAHEEGFESTYFGVALAYSPNGRLLATGAGDGWTNLWDTATWERVGHLETQATGTMAITFSPDGKQLTMITRHGSVADSYDVAGQIQVWDVSSPQSSQRLIQQHVPTNWLTIQWAALSGDGRYAAFSNLDEGVEIHDIRDNRLVGKIAMPTSDAHVEVIALSHAGDLLAFTQYENIPQGDNYQVSRSTVRVLRLHLTDGLVSGYDELGTPLKNGQRGSVGSGGYDLRFSADGSVLTYMTTDTHALVKWNLNTGETRVMPF
jgi:WD40 repeat protein